MSALSFALAPFVGLSPTVIVKQKTSFVMSAVRKASSVRIFTVFARTVIEGHSATGISGKRLSIGIAQTRDFMPEELGRCVQIDETARAVHVAMADPGIEDPQDVHFVQIKCPLLTSDRIEAAHTRGQKVITTSAYGSMGYSRGASALGVASALGEIDCDIRDEHILKLGAVFVCGLHLSWHRAHAQRSDCPWQLEHVGEPLYHRAWRDASFLILLR